MAKTLGHPFIVENKVGASGNVAAQYIADQPADGSMIWLGTQAFVEILPNVFKNPRWSIDSFHPIIRGVEAPLVFVVHPGVPATTFAEFLPGRSRTRASSATPRTSRHTGALPRLPDEREVRPRSHPRALRRLGIAGQCLVGGHAQFGFAQVNSTCRSCSPASSGCLARRETSATSSCRTCQPSPSWAIRNSPPRSGSGSW